MRIVAVFSPAYNSQTSREVKQTDVLGVHCPSYWVSAEVLRLYFTRGNGQGKQETEMIATNSLTEKLSCMSTSSML